MKKKRDALTKWIGSDGRVGEPCTEYYVHIASKFLRMSYADLDAHPRKFELMRTAATLQLGIQAGIDLWKKNEESKAKVGGSS